MAGQLRKLDPNESGGLDCFAFVRGYADDKVYLESAEKAEHFLG